MKYTLIECLIGAVLFGSLIWWSLCKSDEPARLIVRWMITFLMLGGMFTIGLPMITKDAAGKAEVTVGILSIAICGIIIGITWASNWTAIILSPLTSAFDGGDEEPEAKALYSAAEVKRKRGLFHEAIQEIEKQLEIYPGDFLGLLMIAEIQAVNLHELHAAQETIDLICATHNNAPAHVSSALMAMGDWYLKHEQVDAARESFERINQLFPSSSFSQLAAQRVSHLENAQHTINERTRSIVVPDSSLKYYGLQETIKPVVADSDPSARASELLAHLQQHPLDTEVRQKLAVLYAEQFQRIDLAEMEFEQLIKQPNQTTKQIAHYLNLMADWQLKLRNGEAARQTLHRIITSFPKSAPASAAEMRLARLGSEIKGQEKSQASVKLGSYKKDLGLNRDY